MKRTGYYEKTLRQLEKKLEGLKQYEQQLKEESIEAEKILIDPFALSSLIKEQDKENRKMLKEQKNFGKGGDVT